MWLVAVACMVSVMHMPVLAAAADTNTPPKNRGLFITPIRQYVTVAAGAAKNGNFTVANYTDKPMAISFSIKQFSVADYNYDFKFDETVGRNLVTINAADTTLQPNQNKVVPYTIDIPLASTPGGRYYTILATATSLGSKTGLQEQVQAASLVYITVDGNLTYNNNIGAVRMQRLVFGTHIPFSMDVSNTGNTHYFMYLDAHLSGLATSRARVSESHLLLPIKTRHIESTLPSPVLPGIYKATYGYRTEYTAQINRTAWVVFIPPWSIAATLGLAWLGRYAYKRRAAKRIMRSEATKTPPPTTD